MTARKSCQLESVWRIFSLVIVSRKEPENMEKGKCTFKFGHDSQGQGDKVSLYKWP